ncbi:unnamed protein product [Camellia sinensis]
MGGVKILDFPGPLCGDFALVDELYWCLGGRSLPMGGVKILDFPGPLCGDFALVDELYWCLGGRSLPMGWIKPSQQPAIPEPGPTEVVIPPQNLLFLV